MLTRRRGEDVVWFMNGRYDMVRKEEKLARGEDSSPSRGFSSQQLL
jgi:hypothetical protein